MAAFCPELSEPLGERGAEMLFSHLQLCRSSVSAMQIYLDSRGEEIRGISTG